MNAVRPFLPLATSQRQASLPGATVPGLSNH